MKDFNIQDFFNTDWDYGNEVLHNLCSGDNLYHTESSVIIAKTLFIGRIYSASINRVQNPADIETGDIFYTNTVVEKFMDGRIDDDFRMLLSMNAQSIEYDFIPKILQVHKNLVDIIAEIVKQNDRSFASKYLHFHFRNLFFIYDNRAKKGLRKYFKKIPHAYSFNRSKFDYEYASFYCRCHALQAKLKREHPHFADKITPRVVDNILIRRE
jgi:hypothetical protein